jgi:hypothetical protein
LPVLGEEGRTDYYEAMEFTTSLAVQTWVMYALGVLLIAGRM